jgi:hypothetical protein
MIYFNKKAEITKRYKETDTFLTNIKHDFW